MTLLQAEVKLVEGTMSVAFSRNHAVVIDRPEAAGGADRGFLGGELLLAAQGGCFLSNLVAAASARRLNIRGAHISVSGETADKPSRFASVRVAVSLDSDMSDPEVDRLLAVASRACIVTNTLRRGTDLAIVRGDASDGRTRQETREQEITVP